jgi:hypothetical protein
MRLLPSDPDVATIVGRIRNGDLDLQPDFQRGEVWSEVKKQKLIDSVLREWHVPPVHVIELPGSARQEVLDGQQRLTAIRDFVNGDLRIDGHIEPLDSGIRALHKCGYDDLPAERKRKFDQFTIRVFRITDFEPGEPGELFYRLNQPANLTAAEQRNAFFGPARQQVKALVEELEDGGINKEFIGFSNSRMAYDDVVARLCCSLEVGSLSAKISAGEMTARYRAKVGFPTAILERCRRVIALLGEARDAVTAPVRFNKATLYSWMWFIGDVAVSKGLTPKELGAFIDVFELTRMTVAQRIWPTHAGEYWIQKPHFIRRVISTFNDRATSRVADVTSVLSRDAVLWVMFAARRPLLSTPLSKSSWKAALVVKLLKETRDSEAAAADALETLIQTREWGAAL